MGDGGHPGLGNPVVRGTEVTLGLEEPMLWESKVTLGLRDPMVALGLGVPVMWGMEVTLDLGVHCVRTDIAPELGDPMTQRVVVTLSFRGHCCLGDGGHPEAGGPCGLEDGGRLGLEDPIV